MLTTRSSQLIEQGLGLLQVEGVEAFGEPAVDRGEKIAGLLPFAVVAPQPGQARRRAQFPGLCLLRAGDGDGSLEMRLVVVAASVPAALPFGRGWEWSPPI